MRIKHSRNFRIPLFTKNYNMNSKECKNINLQLIKKMLNFRIEYSVAAKKPVAVV